MALFENVFHGLIRAPLLLNSQLRCTGTDRPMPMPPVFGLVLPANFFAVLAIFDKDRRMRAECPIREARSERNSFRRAFSECGGKVFRGRAGRAWGSRICAEHAAGQHRKPEGKRTTVRSSSVSVRPQAAPLSADRAEARHRRWRTRRWRPGVAAFR